MWWERIKNSLSTSLIKPKALDSLVSAIWESNAVRVVEILSMTSVAYNTRAQFDFLDKDFDLSDLRTWEAILESDLQDGTLINLPLNISSESMLDKVLPVFVEAHVSIEKPQKDWENKKTLKKMKPGGFIKLLEVQKGVSNIENKYKFSYEYWKKKRIITLNHTDFEITLSRVLKPSFSHRLFLDWWSPNIREMINNQAA